MSNSQIIPGGYPTPALSTVATDQQTIFGSGSQNDPLTTNNSGGGSTGPTFKATLFTGNIFADHIGQPVTTKAGAPEFGVSTVQKASSTAAIALAQCVGLMIALDVTTGACTVQYDGIVTLTTAQWDAFASTTGGLVADDTYYVNAAGHISFAPNVVSGQWSVQVGVALNATQLLLSTPSLPLLNP